MIVRSVGELRKILFDLPDDTLLSRSKHFQITKAHVVNENVMDFCHSRDGILYGCCKTRGTDNIQTVVSIS